MSLFGNTSTNPPAGGGLFGSTNTAQPAGGLFGNNTTGQTGGGLFGNAGNTGGGLFGATNTANNTGQNQGGGGLFGSNTNQPQQPSGGGLFGNTAANPQTGGLGGGLFGNTAANANSTAQQPGGGLFGNNNTTQPGTGLFGSTNTNTAAPSLTLNTGGGLFGNNANNTASNPLFGNKNPTNIFGSSSNTNAAGTNPTPNPTNPLFGGGTGLFGSTNNQQSQQPATGGGLFGAPNNNQQQQQQPQQQQPGLFGSTNNAQQPSVGLFGQKPASTLFGSTANNNPLTASALNPLSNMGNANQGGGLFGSTLQSNNNLASTARGSAGEVDAPTQFAALTGRIEGIAAAWNSQSPDCRFQHYFFNLVDPAQVNLYGRPPNATNEALWQKAVRENPDRTCLVPVVAIGFDDLQQRVDAQAQQATAHHEKLKELRSRIEALSQRHSISNATRLSRASAIQTQITHRLLRLIQHLHLLIPALRSSAIRPEEEALRMRLEEIEEDVRRGRLRGKLNELWAVVGALGNSARGSREGGGGGTEWAVVDEEGLGQIAAILTEQQAGLQHLTRILQQEMKDVAVILGNGGEAGDGADSGFNPSSTLRASALR
ncbi:hypothetical protein FIBSPDRAFT_1047146 [Athelia psychrophila]|uniref:Nucleoporin Nup54 alpha-helical domain-containing protein n=1 Tax=Athelia psychrophila TaxID=1759441 RepID=A0A166FQ55_9AGAM|nr:hypothetical protein FIBSPDRAFT_1047146 [Fibularhizoctonia sp. CBS 109695]